MLAFSAAKRAAASALALGVAIVYSRCGLAAESAPAAVSSTASTAATPQAGVDFFEAKIRPALARHCYQCHSADAKKLQGGLHLDSRDGLSRGGDSGPAIAPGKPDESLLIQAVRYGEDSFQMPPSGKLSADVIADFEKWVAMGAPDPRVSAPAKPAVAAIDLVKGREFWCFQPLSTSPPPQVRVANWARSDIDRFILHRLEESNLAPAADADRYTLLRRVTYDLIGLPPTPQEIEAFISDRHPNAFKRVVDRLLASPHFGERWARHWLDVVRYADSNGAAMNFTFDTAWRYRDFVIESFNRDKPFDHFVRQQIAGDLLPYSSSDEQAENITATAYLLFGAKQIAQYDKPKLRMDVIDEQIDTIGRSLLGLTIGCARCHDHKFDPIPTADYYALAGIFSSTVTLEGSWTENKLYTGWVVRPLPLKVTQEHKQALADHKVAMEKARKRLRAKEAELRKLEEQLESLASFVTGKRAGNNIALAGMSSSKPDHAELMGKMKAMKSEVVRLDDEWTKVKEDAPDPLPEVMSVKEGQHPANLRIHIRGAVDNLGAEVHRGFLRVASFESAPEIHPRHSGRLELADWLTDRRNPLTARVLVNRVWQHLVGQGIVRTVDNFGVRGERPTHPELLDHLASTFMDNNWSIKSLVRRIVLSHAYQVGAQHDVSAYAKDPENRLLARRHRHRLDADALRDSLLAIGGQMDFTRGGPTLPYTGLMFSKGLYLRTKHRPPWERRSIYLPITRDGQLPECDVLEIFDFPDPNLVTGQRAETNVPTQALYLMNSPLVIEQAKKTAELVLAQPDLDEAARVRLLYLKVFGHPASEAQIAAALKFVNRWLAIAGDGATAQDASAGGAKSDVRLRAWSSLCHSLFGTSDFLYLN